MRFVIRGVCWNAGNDIFIDAQNENGEWTIVCLNDLMKYCIKENSRVNIVIDVEDN